MIRAHIHSSSMAMCRVWDLTCPGPTCPLVRVYTVRITEHPTNERDTWTLVGTIQYFDSWRAAVNRANVEVTTQASYWKSRR